MRMAERKAPEHTIAFDQTAAPALLDSNAITWTLVMVQNMGLSLYKVNVPL